MLCCVWGRLCVVLYCVECGSICLLYCVRAFVCDVCESFSVVWYVRAFISCVVFKYVCVCVCVCVW